jgi:hypothetical protein
MRIIHICCFFRQRRSSLMVESKLHNMTTDQEKNTEGQENTINLESGEKGAIARMPKEDMLNLEKGAAAMDQIKRSTQHISGKTISGAGAGPGTGDTGGDFDRPGTEGTPAINDYVDPEGIADDTDTTRQEDERAVVAGSDLPEGGLAEGEFSSGFPGGGVRTAEDWIPPAASADDDTGFMPEEPLNRPKNPGSGGAAERQNE